MLVPTGGFSIDGDLSAGSSAGPGDWVPGPNGGGVLDANGVPWNPATTFHYTDPYDSPADATFGGGLKWTDDPNLWTFTSGKSNAKTDINNVLLHIVEDGNQHTWLVIAADRFSNSGDSYLDFELLRKTR